MRDAAAVSEVLKPPLIGYTSLTTAKLVVIVTRWNHNHSVLAISQHSPQSLTSSALDTGEARPSKRINMSLTSILSAEDIENAVKEFQAPDSFSFKKFFQLCGLTSKSPKEVKDVFQILDDDNSGYIEESELKFFLQRFVPGARTLTDAECKGFLSAADDDNDGKIGVEEFLIMVQS
ncbi:hypothetical protein J4Q44_G00002630 [Coregonus suidteri]